MTSSASMIGVFDWWSTGSSYWFDEFGTMFSTSGGATSMVCIGISKTNSYSSEFVWFYYDNYSYWFTTASSASLIDMFDWCSTGSSSCIDEFGTMFYASDDATSIV